MPEEAESRVLKESILEAVTPISLGSEDYFTLVTPAGAERDYVDLERFRATPRRTTGKVILNTKQSFTHFVNEHKVAPSTHLYVDAETFNLVAVFNDDNGEVPAPRSSEDEDQASSKPAAPGWGDNRATLPMQKTPEWKLWTSHDRKLMDQEEFAELVEEGQREIIEPSAAQMLELAQTFHVTTNASFTSANILRSGERTLSYAENQNAQAGSSGEITIPREFVLSIIPFETELLSAAPDDNQPYAIHCRFRHRLSGNKLSLGYVMDRPEQILRTAFVDTVNWIASDTGLRPLYGLPRSR